MKPLVRWTVGPVPQRGIDLLCLSINKWRSVYNDDFDMVVCYNGIDSHQISQIPIETIDQNDYTDSIKYKPFDTTWKLYPPRLRMDSHEIFIDNDLVVYDRSPTIDKFLHSSSMSIITSAHRRFYGAYNQLVSPDLTVNSGLFGLPPNFDLGRSINRFIAVYPRLGWLEHCDDEGVLACILSKNNLCVIPMEEIHVCNPSVDFSPYSLGSCGTHFAGSNQGHTRFLDRYLLK